MSKKEIYWLHSHLNYSTGGTRFIFEVTSRLQRNYNVTIIVESISIEWKERFKQKGIEVVELLSFSSYAWYYWLLFPIFILIDLYKIQRLIPRGSLVFTSMFPMNLVSLMSQYQVINYCFEPFAFFYDKELIATFSPLKRCVLIGIGLVIRPFDKISLKKARLLLAINPSVGEWIKKVYSREPELYSYLGVDFSHFKKRKVKKQKELTLFHSTDYTSLKGTWYLLKALPHVKDTHFQLLVSETIHNPEEKKKMITYLTVKGLSNKVKFLGHLSYQDLPLWYSKSDIYCFTGDPLSAGATAASLSVLEAAACELPVVRSIGNTDEVKHNQTGYLVDSRDPMQIATALVALAKDNKRRLAFGKRGAKHVLSYYTWEKVTKRLETAISKVEK